MVLQGRAERAREESLLLEQATAARSDRLTLQLAQQVCGCSCIMTLPGCMLTSEKSRDMEPPASCEIRHRTYFCLHCIAF